jgi:hypothetical protein
MLFISNAADAPLIFPIMPPDFHQGHAAFYLDKSVNKAGLLYSFYLILLPVAFF